MLISIKVALILSITFLFTGCNRIDRAPGVPTGNSPGGPPMDSTPIPQPTPSFQGHETGNGGGGIRCENEKSRLFDFWEAAKYGGLVISEGNVLAVKKQIMMASGALIQGGERSLAEAVLKLALSIRAQTLRGDFFAPPTEATPPPLDWPFERIPLSCTPFGIGLYFDAFERMQVDQAALESLSSTGQAGFFVHEAVFRLFRSRFGVRDSRFARNLTACLFADPPCPELSFDYGLPEEKHAICREAGTLDASASSFYVYPSPREGLRFHVRRLNGKLPPTLTYFDVPGSMEWGASPVLFKPVKDQAQVIGYSRANDNPEFPIGPQLRFEVRFGETVSVNGKRLLCETSSRTARR